MRISIIGSCLIAWAIETGVADAAFIIQLKNGNEFVTGRHWQEGTQVMFDVYGGVLGVEKNFVTKIDRSDKPIRLLIETQHNEVEKSGAVKNQSDTDKSPSVIDEVKVKRDPNDPIVKEFAVIKQRFSTIGGMLTSELNEFSKNVANLKRRIQTSGESNNYLDEFTELHKIGDELEAILKERN